MREGTSPGAAKKQTARNSGRAASGKKKWALFCYEEGNACQLLACKCGEWGGWVRTLTVLNEVAAKKASRTRQSRAMAATTMRRYFRPTGSLSLRVLSVWENELVG